MKGRYFVFIDIARLPMLIQYKEEKKKYIYVGTVMFCQKFVLLYFRYGSSLFTSDR